ncbi:DUF7738 domain-containing protein [Pseudomonas huanghezhanensis]|uniref:DUF7738 domain-containing protein n=1 Tax=Pseudomonas huanghezhanensis TaxID=3002903 RepID=UPI002285CCD1|nr:hypothetical protein [Pseudomonas sp. BSw22131]
MRQPIVFSCLVFIFAIVSQTAGADGLLGDITWENTKAELSRLNDWSLGIRRIPKGAKPEIIVNDGEITFNGEVLRFGDDINVWKKIIGGIPREMPSQRLYIWDEMGIKVGIGWGGSTKVVFINVIFHCKERGSSPVCPESGGPGNENEPKNFFAGYLEYEGGPIDSISTVLEANRLIKGAANFGRGCGLGLCSVSHGLHRDILSGADTVGRNLESTIYKISFDDFGVNAEKKPKDKIRPCVEQDAAFGFDGLTKQTAEQAVGVVSNWISNFLCLPDTRQAQP